MSTGEEPTASALVAAALDMGAAGLGSVLIETTFLDDTVLIDSATTETEMAAKVDEAMRGLEVKIGTAASERLMPLYEGLKTAVTEGEVLPGEAQLATNYVIGTGGVKILAVGGAAALVIAKLFHDFAAEYHNPTRRPPAPPKPVRHPTRRPAPPALTVPIAVPEPNTPGGRIVAEAEKSLKSLRITAPGLSATAARSVSIAIAEAYKDTLTVLVGSLNHVEAQISGTQAEISKLDGQLGTVAKVAGTVPTLTTVEISGLDGTISRIERGMRTLDTRIGNVETEITHISGQPVTTTTPPAAPPSPGLTPAQAAEVATIPQLATSASVTQVGIEAAAALALAKANAPTPGNAYVPNLPTKMQTLEDCCAANTEVTQPIRSGGATPSLLSKLGGLLVKAYALGIVASVIEVGLSLLDMPDVILGEMRTIAWIEPIAKAAAAGALADLSWSGELAAAQP